MLELKEIEKRYGKFYLHNISFKISKTKILSIIGPSGSGKSTIIKIIMGIIKPDKGTLLFDNRDISSFPPEVRNFGYIPQSIGLFPHLNVKRNIEFPLKIRKIKKNIRDTAVLEIMKDFDLMDLSERYPANLSGGEKQKVALARAIIFNPDIILMDEPMNSIDFQKREKYLNFIKKTNKKYGTPIIYVTHNLEEAVAISDEMVAIKRGEIIKHGTLNDFMREPDDVWIASFFRHKNIISGYLKNRELKVNNSDLIIKTSLEGEGEKDIMIRGDEIIISKKRISSSALNCFKGRIKDVIPNLYNTELIIDVGGIEFRVLITEKSYKSLDLSVASSVYLSFKANSVKNLRGDFIQ